MSWTGNSVCSLSSKRRFREAAFELWDSFGFPIDLTQLMCEERHLKVDIKRYEACLEEQRTRSRESGKKLAENKLKFEAEATGSLQDRSIQVSFIFERQNSIVPFRQRKTPSNTSKKTSRPKSSLCSRRMDSWIASTPTFLCLLASFWNPPVSTQNREDKWAIPEHWNGKMALPTWTIVNRRQVMSFMFATKSRFLQIP